MKNLLYIFCIAIICTGTANAQTKINKKGAQTAAMAALVDSKNFIFEANYVNPQRGGGRTLSGGYDLTISPDTISSYLPFFGVAHLADFPSTDGGVKFNWTNFNYKVTPGKKGSKEILITPNDKNAADPKAVQSLRLYITSDGYASLQVISYNRDPISFSGTIEDKHSKVQASL